MQVEGTALELWQSGNSADAGRETEKWVELRKGKTAAAAARQTRSIPPVPQLLTLTFGAEEDDGYQQDQADEREDHTHYFVRSCVPGCLLFLLFEHERTQEHAVNAMQECSP